jgi:hypothetical protein
MSRLLRGPMESKGPATASKIEEADCAAESHVSQAGQGSNFQFTIFLRETAPINPTPLLVRISPHFA